VTLVAQPVAAASEPASSLVAALWRSVMPSLEEVRRARRRLHGKAMVILALVAASYWALVLSDLALLVRLGAAGVLVFGLVAVATSIMHDANHDSFSGHRWLNRVLAYTSDTLGASSWLWRFQHNTLHHGNANVAGFDADIALFPFARLAPSQRWHFWYRAQHVYMWPLYGFLALKNLLVSDLLATITGRLDRQPIRQPRRPSVIARITVGKLAHLRDHRHR
jgi:linoleoyl-CoA desaturase